MKTLKAIKYNEGYLFVDMDADPYPLGLHLEKNEIIEVQGVGEKSGEVFHEKGFNYKNEVAKIVGQYNLNIPYIYYVELDLNFLDKELRLHRNLIKTATTPREQDMILSRCDMISFLKQKYKSVEQKKYTEEDLRKAFNLGKQIGYKLDFDSWSGIKDEFINSLYPPIISIGIETIHVMPQENGTRSDEYITDEISLNPKFNTLEVPIVYQKYGKEHLTIININYENLHHTED